MQLANNVKRGYKGPIKGEFTRADCHRRVLFNGDLGRINDVTPGGAAVVTLNTGQKLFLYCRRTVGNFHRLSFVS